jgi:eukaryotic-like serine/threonine-protein kinase
MREPGSRLLLGNYEPLLQLATGGMATVYVARQVGAAGFERLVVVKRVHPHLLTNREFYDMFRDEARVAAMLHHPNVVPVIDVVEAEGELFLVMEYVESAALSTLMKAASDLEQRLQPAVVVRILVDTLSGLHAAHDAIDMRGNKLELVHRDVSPQNVIVGTDGSSRLIDFGVAKARHRLTETKSGSLKGKYGYMSPEQARAHPLDRRADLFSAGIVLWEALTGKRLFRGETEFDTIRRIAEAPIQAPSEVVPSLPKTLDAVVLKALAREPEGRYQTAAEFVEALEGAFFPAPARDAASVVKAYCGERIESRRTTLEGMLDGRIEPLSASRLSLGGTDPAGTIDASPAAHAARKLAKEEEGTESQIAATHDAPAPRRPTRNVALVAGGFALLAVGGVAAAFALGAHRSTPPPVAATSSATPPTAASPGDTSDVAPDEVAIELTAQASIESVRALGMRDVSVRDNHARLVVSRWGGELPIDGVLQGGVAVHVVARSDGPRDLVLAPVATVTSPASVAPATTKPTTKTGTKTPPPQTTSVPTQTSELHENPYGTVKAP